MSTYTTEVSADSPLAWYRMDASSGTSESDNSGNAHTGTYSGSPTLNVTSLLLADVDADKAVTFASASSQRLLADVLGSLGSNALTSTAEFWIKTTTTNTLQAAFGTVKTGTTMMYACYLNTDFAEAASVGKTTLAVRDNAGVLRRGHMTKNIYDGVPHHVVWEVIASTGLAFACWVDGVSQTVTMGDVNVLGTMANFDFGMGIGGRNVRGTFDRYCDATLDEVAFYTSRLSSTRIAAHYNAGRGRTHTTTGTVRLTGSSSELHRVVLPVYGSILLRGTGSQSLSRLLNLSTTSVVAGEHESQVLVEARSPTGVVFPDGRKSVVLDYERSV